jgi:4-hydroxy-tetrahydrodipicolinate synthase
MQAGGSGSINGLANVAPHLMARIIRAPEIITAVDTQLVTDLLALLGVRPNMPFVSVYKQILAEQTSDATWLNTRAPLSPLTPDEGQAVRDGYRALGTSLNFI